MSGFLETLFWIGHSVKELNSGGSQYLEDTVQSFSWTELRIQEKNLMKTELDSFFVHKNLPIFSISCLGIKGICSSLISYLDWTYTTDFPRIKRPLDLYEEITECYCIYYTSKTWIRLTVININITIFSGKSRYTVAFIVTWTPGPVGMRYAATIVLTLADNQWYGDINVRCCLTCIRGFQIEMTRSIIGGIPY